MHFCSDISNADNIIIIFNIVYSYTFITRKVVQLQMVVQQVDDIALRNGCFMGTKKLGINFTAARSMYKSKFFYVTLAANKMKTFPDVRVTHTVGH